MNFYIGLSDKSLRLLGDADSRSVWSILGNTGTDDSTNFLGTTDDQDLVFKVNNITAGRIATTVDGNPFQNSLSLGPNTIAGKWSTFIGAYAGSINSSTPNTSAVAVGFNAKSNNNAVAIGDNANAAGTQSIAIGRTSSAVQNSVAIGVGVNAINPNTIILGTNQNIGIGINTPSSRLEVDSGTPDDSGLRLSQISTTTTPVDAQPLGIDTNGKVVVSEKPTLVNNGDGTATFSNAPGTSDDVTFTTQTSGTNTIVTSTLWIDTSSVPVTTTLYDQGKSFIVPGGTLGDSNAIRIVCYRIGATGGNNAAQNNNRQQIRLQYGNPLTPDVFYTSGSLGNGSARVEFIIFADGSTGSQKSFMDDANTGASGQRFGSTTIDSTVDQPVSILIRETVSVGDGGSLDFCSAETLIIGN